MTRIVLASGSSTRRAILANAGIRFEAIPSDVDERRVEEPLIAAGRSAAEIAMALAEAKALDVGAHADDATVIGADQTLDADGRRWIKPASMDEARDQLVTLAGRSHKLQTAVAGVRDGAIRWRHLDSATLTLRPLTPDAIDRYLDTVGEAALGSVGAYQIEGPGIQLFERIEGDFFTILGLPILPLLAWLRAEGALE
ncbi:MAG: Maf family protein [Bauldia sp.]|nr:Maf family protein [Bauldia sp.]